MLNVYWWLLLKQLDTMNCFEDLKNILLEEEEETGVILEDYSFYEAGIELMIILNRLDQGKYLIRFNDESKEEIEISSKYPFSKSVLKKIGRKYDVKITEEEILMFTKHLRGKDI